MADSCSIEANLVHPTIGRCFRLIVPLQGYSPSKIGLVITTIHCVTCLWLNSKIRVLYVFIYSSHFLKHHFLQNLLRDSDYVSRENSHQHIWRKWRKKINVQIEEKSLGKKMLSHSWNYKCYLIKNFRLLR